MVYETCSPYPRHSRGHGARRARLLPTLRFDTRPDLATGAGDGALRQQRF
jgi:hypothetical protein